MKNKQFSLLILCGTLTARAWWSNDDVRDDHADDLDQSTETQLGAARAVDPRHAERQK